MKGPTTIDLIERDLRGAAVRDFREIVERARREHRPRAAFGMLSGGNDSTSMVHALWLAGLIDAAVHINTGIGVPQTRTFVVDVCATYGIPLIELHPPEITFEEYVRRWGFPGPGAHSKVYVWLKERAIDAFMREQKKRRSDRILLVTGVRLDESQRRMGYVEPITATERRPCQVWVAPFLDWTSEDLRFYREEHGVPESEVARLLKMSGECLCGAFASPGELERLRALYPDVAAEIDRLAAIARACGKPDVWGVRPFGYKKRRGRAAPGMLCTRCEQIVLFPEVIAA